MNWPKRHPLTVYIRNYHRSATGSSIIQMATVLIKMMKSPCWKTLELTKISDVRGNLSVAEGGKNIPFNVARIYYIYDVPSGSSRAGHAHKELRQLFLALSGSFNLHLDDGSSTETILLNRPDTGLLVEPGVWRVIDNFSGGAVCLVLASHHYNEADYIRDHSEFKTYVREKHATSPSA